MRRRRPEAMLLDYADGSLPSRDEVDAYARRLRGERDINGPDAGTSDSAPPGEEPLRPGRVVVRLSDVQPESIAWLWEQRIPFGKMTMLSGPPGDGKSTAMIDLAARLSTGRAMPESEGRMPPTSVVIMSAEDGLSDTIRPRLDAAGADPSRVFAMTSIVGRDGHERMPAIPEDLGELELLVREVGARLVVVDVLDAYLSGGVDSHRSTDVRRALTPFSKMAEATGAAVVCLGHLRKAGGGRALYRALGSIGITGAARSALVLSKDPDDPNLRILAPSKSNLGPEAPALRLQLVSAGLAARVEWLGVADGVTADDLDQEREGDRDRTGTEEATEWLREVLGQGPVPKSEVDRAARKEGFSDWVLRAARERLDVKVSRAGHGKDHHTIWSTPVAHGCTTRVEPSRTDSEPKQAQLLPDTPASTRVVATRVVDSMDSTTGVLEDVEVEL